jgi:hypothetical protein
MILQTVSRFCQRGNHGIVLSYRSNRSVPFSKELILRKLLVALLAGLFVIGANASDKKQVKKKKQQKIEKNLKH